MCFLEFILSSSEDDILASVAAGLLNVVMNSPTSVFTPLWAPVASAQ